MTDKNELKECFIIMPIGSSGEHSDEHFKHVYDNIIKPSCTNAGFNPVRGDDVKQTNLIHLDILQKLIDAPIAICDLSTRNPNVLFELGIRQAFDMPVVLIQEIGTKKIFDITPLRYLEYCKNMKYHDVLQSQKELKEAITATVESNGKSGSVNSIVKLLSLSHPASIPDFDENVKEKFAIDVIQSEMRDMRRLMERFIYKQRTQQRQIDNDIPLNDISHREYLEEKMMKKEIQSLMNGGVPHNEIIEIFSGKAPVRQIRKFISQSKYQKRNEESENNVD